MKRKLSTSFLIVLLLLIPFVAYAAEPVLFFSDMDSGPRIGLTDDNVSNQGIIVTVWGKNLGSSKGTSKIYVGSSTSGWTEAAYVYYWKNDNGELPGGPANLYESHQMQEIAFSIPSASADVAGKIYVVVGGINSNELDFNNRFFDWMR